MNYKGGYVLTAQPAILIVASFFLAAALIIPWCVAQAGKAVWREVFT